LGTEWLKSADAGLTDVSLHSLVKSTGDVSIANTILGKCTVIYVPGCRCRVVLAVLTTVRIPLPI
jgi:hypothetical protein